jgi:hypothetical protein
LLLYLVRFHQQVAEKEEQQPLLEAQVGQVVVIPDRLLVRGLVILQAQAHLRVMLVEHRGFQQLLDTLAVEVVVHQPLEVQLFH